MSVPDIAQQARSTRPRRPHPPPPAPWGPRPLFDHPLRVSLTARCKKISISAQTFRRCLNLRSKKSRTA
eukprot:761682-Rhodomonas_salina.1